MIRKYLPAIAALFIPSIAHAYIGPGALIGLLGFTLSMGWMIVLTVLGALAWPLALLWQKRRRKKHDEQN